MPEVRDALQNQWRWPSPGAVNHVQDSSRQDLHRLRSGHDLTQQQTRSRGTSASSTGRARSWPFDEASNGQAPATVESFPETAPRRTSISIWPSPAGRSHCGMSGPALEGLDGSLVNAAREKSVLTPDVRGQPRFPFYDRQAGALIRGDLGGLVSGSGSRMGAAVGR
jgi:hypothetical protein